ncbi:S-formylglutathione hydrolase [Herbaspirillum sp. Sphag1AN]|uniref:S-formylglutathione hydrolase n=1 Tax=unclassified Herbaspirillum TaxID=2624150 RepID=UPI00161C3876|nr:MULTISPECIES: S-formylglutathione hydrolase [unclassified Herbaspirillum]MBB3212759.1 S-formylglutathione hydrolase [Herbaspirillum sp. Sphag1AN]MBB3245956.1 S-formylglutathione hydrolase [Herbaspirillum sp. Sphag64]
MAIELLSEHACFGGVQQFYQHHSTEIGLPMRFSVFVPPQAAQGKVPVLFYLAGLTCTEETFVIKAGAQRVAAELGIMLVSPDTSPRGANIVGESDSWDFGVAAGFYVDATQAPWSSHYRMESYVTGELRQLVLQQFAANQERIGIFGHSMGGHGALTLALRHRDLYHSVSAFAPIAAPSQCPWGEKAFSHYLGNDKAVWQQHDASALMRNLQRPFPKGILIDQGLSDKFLAEQLLPEEFESACVAAAQPLRLRRHAGYDHGYYFISSFMEDHLRFHAEVLG